MVDYIDLKEMLPSMQQTLSSGGEVSFTVAGNSMRPFLVHQRDTVTLKKPEALKKYDVVLFSRPDGNLVLHRIISEKNDTFLIRGDNCYYDEYVKSDNIIAVARNFIKKGKRIDVSNFGYKVYCFLHCNAVCFFFRKTIWARVKSLARKIFKK